MHVSNYETENTALYCKWFGGECNIYWHREEPGYLNGIAQVYALDDRGF